MKSKEEILFNYMDEALQVKTEDQLKAMQEYMDQGCLEFMRWYLKNKVSKFEADRVIENFKEYFINEEIAF